MCTRTYAHVRTHIFPLTVRSDHALNTFVLKGRHCVRHHLPRHVYALKLEIKARENVSKVRVRRCTRGRCPLSSKNVTSTARKLAQLNPL